MNSSRTAARGSIAVVSLWVIILLAFLAIGLGESVRQKITVFNHLRARAQARTISESVVKKIITGIQESPVTLGDTATGDEWYTGVLGRPQSLSFGDGITEYVIEDENSKMNLNKASAYYLANLFRFAAGLDAGAAGRLADAAADFRDEDDYVTGEGVNGGSEKGVYRQARLGHAPKNFDFEFPQELLLVAGMTKEVYGLIANYITIYGDGRININTCGRQTLETLDLPDSLVTKIIKMRNGPDLKSGTADDFVFKEVSKIEEDLLRVDNLQQEEKIALMHAIVHGELCVTSSYFKITGRTRIHGAPGSDEFVCVYGKRDGIKYWSES